MHSYHTGLLLALLHLILCATAKPVTVFKKLTWSLAAACSFCWCFLMSSGGPHTLLDTPKAPLLTLACCAGRSPAPRGPVCDPSGPGLHNSTSLTCHVDKLGDSFTCRTFTRRARTALFYHFTVIQEGDGLGDVRSHLAAFCRSIVEGPGSWEGPAALAGRGALPSRLSSRSSMSVLAFG